MSSCKTYGDHADLERRMAETIVYLGDHILQFEYGTIGEKYEEKAKRELRETPNIVEESLERFRTLIQDEPGLEYPDDDDNLITYLRPCKFYPESALEKLKKYYKFKLKHPKYFDNLLPSNVKDVFKQSLPTILPVRTKDGERILILEAGKKWNPKTCSLNEFVRGVILLLEAALAEARTQIGGAQVILDMDGLSLNHVWQFSPSFAKDIVHLIQECVPLRLKGVHVVNQPYVFNMLFAIFKPFLSEKLRSRIHFYGTNFSELHDRLDATTLPTQYNGTLDIPMDQGEKLHSALCNFDTEFKLKMHRGYMHGIVKK